MRDWDIRRAVTRQLRTDHPDQAEHRIWSEFSVRLGASRVDLCLINGALTGFEIKSPRDNLDRINAQIIHYSAVLDYAAVVCHERHVEHLLDRIPSWWGLIVAAAEDDAGPGDGVTLRQVRPRSINPSVDALSVAQLLWRDEALDLLRELDAHRGLSKSTRWAMWDRLIEACPLVDLQEHVRSALKKRPPRTTDLALALDGAM